MTGHPRLFGILCIRNEASRYLTECLAWHMPLLDDVFVYDDQSTDDSAQIASMLGATVETRPDGVASFLEHEGEFRQAAWEAFELRMRPSAGDWVLAFDADEFIVAPSQIGVRLLLQTLATGSQDLGMMGCKLKIHEVFHVDANNVPWVRTDGYWDDISGLRFFEYRMGGRFANRKMGCGSAPFYVEPVDRTMCVEILHFGYARAEDRQEKYLRYNGLPGHSIDHVESINGVPLLEPWHGVTPHE